MLEIVPEPSLAFRFTKFFRMASWFVDGCWFPFYLACPPAAAPAFFC